MIEWISVKESLPTKSGRYLTAARIYGSYTCGVSGFSLNLYEVDKYDFPKKQYKNKKGFFFYDSEYGYIEQPNVEFRATINTPNGEAKDTELIDILLKNGCPAEVLFNSIVEYGERLNGNKE